MRKLLLVLALATGIALGQPANTELSNPGGGGAPTGSAGGDLSGTYPNPTVAKVNGTTIPTNSAADQIINTTASAVAQWTAVPNCQDASGNHLNYNTTTHVLSCGTSSSSSLSGGTTNALAKWTSSTAIGNSVVTDNGTIVSSSEPVDVTSQSLVIEVTNDGVTGTTVNKLAKVNTSGNAIVITTSAADQTAAIGCVTGGAGTTGSAQIAVIGQASCFFDNTATTNGDYVVVSSATAATLNDAGATFPTSGEVLGRVLSTHAACGAPPCGPYTVLFMTPDIVAAGSGGGGKVANATAGDIAVYTGKNAIGGETGAGLLKYSSANTNYATPLLKLDNPSASGSAAETISFYSNSGTERARISANQNGGLTLSSDIQGTGSKPLVISTFDVGGAQTDTITISTNVGSSGVNSLPAGWIALNASQGSAGVYIQSGTNITIGANGAANISTDIAGIDMYTPGSAKPGLRLRNGTSSGADATANPFQIVNTTLNSPTVLASIGPLAQPASVGTSPGTNELSVFSLTGGGGGNTTSAGTSVGGNAGGMSVTTGNGGTANSVSGAHNDTGGNGGNITFTTGNGAAASATDTGTNLGGNAGFFKIVLGSGGAASNGSVNTAGNSGYFQIGPAVAFATLPSCAAGLEGAMAPVTDSNTAVFNATIANGGANHILAYCNGTNWTVH